MRNVILCGGSGTRLWPLSRRLMPKQFLQLFDKKSLFQKTMERNSAFCDDFLVITNEEQYFLALDQIDELGLSTPRFLLEETGRNTAPAIAFAAFASDDDEILFVTPSDHLIKNMEKYQEAVQRAEALAKEGYLVTFGIEPTEPHTGYGYIEYAKNDVKRFHEKPDLATARRYLAQNENSASTRYLWNSGMFMFQARVYLEELQKYAPEIYEVCKEVYENHLRPISDTQARITNMHNIPDISIDYAVMEKSDKIKVVPGEFEWNDVGSFDSLVDEIDSKEAIEVDSQNNFYYSDNDKKVIATIGLEDFILIDTKDSLLIAKRGQTQKVRNIVAQLKKIDPELLATHSIVHRPWGTYEVLIDDRGYKIKRIVVKPGKRLSLQKHYHRNEHWIVLSGTATVTVGDKTYYVRPNESTYIKMGEVHRLANEGKIPVVLIEAQVGEYTGEDDIVRIDDDFKRG